MAELSNGTLTAKYLRGMNLISRTDSSQTTYYLFNAHGDVVDLANSSGSSVKSYDYDAFGNEKSPSASDRNPFRYCGEYWDTETGTYYLRARYYAPSSAASPSRTATGPAPTPSTATTPTSLPSGRTPWGSPATPTPPRSAASCRAGISTSIVSMTPSTAVTRKGNFSTFLLELRLGPPLILLPRSL